MMFYLCKNAHDKGIEIRGFEIRYIGVYAAYLCLTAGNSHLSRLLAKVVQSYI